MGLRRILDHRKRKEPTRAHCIKIIKRQQDVINVVLQSIHEARGVMESLLPPKPGEIVKPTQVPFIIPTGGNQ